MEFQVGWPETKALDQVILLHSKVSISHLSPTMIPIIPSGLVVLFDSWVRSAVIRVTMRSLEKCELMKLWGATEQISDIDFEQPRDFYQGLSPGQKENLIKWGLLSLFFSLTPPLPVSFSSLLWRRFVLIKDNRFSCWLRHIATSLEVCLRSHTPISSLKLFKYFQKQIQNYQKRSPKPLNHSVCHPSLARLLLAG